MCIYIYLFIYTHREDKASTNKHRTSSSTLPPLGSYAQRSLHSSLHPSSVLLPDWHESKLEGCNVLQTTSPVVPEVDWIKPRIAPSYGDILPVCDLAWPDSWISVTCHQRTLHLSVYCRINFTNGETSCLADSHKTVYQIPCCSVHSRFIWRRWVNASHFTALNGWMASDKWNRRNVEAEGRGLICSTISADTRTTSQTHNTLS